MKFISIIGLGLIFSAILAVFVMLFWNYAFVGAVDGIKEISYFQAWGIFLLANLIFNSKLRFKS